MKTSLRITGASRVLGGQTVLRNIDLALEAGAFLVVAGESGSGKMTMLRMIAGLDRANAGSIEINGTLVDDAERLYGSAHSAGHAAHRDRPCKNVSLQRVRNALRMIPVLIATFLTASVEWVEAYTIILAVAVIRRGKRTPLWG